MTNLQREEFADSFTFIINSLLPHDCTVINKQVFDLAVYLFNPCQKYVDIAVEQWWIASITPMAFQLDHGVEIASHHHLLDKCFPKSLS